MSGTRRLLLASAGLFAAMLLLMMSRGLTNVLVGVRAELQGFNTTVSGVVMAAYFIGFLAGAKLTPRVIATVGHARVFGGLASLVAVSTLIHAIWVTPLAWSLLRVVFGFAMAGSFVVAESWLNEAASNQNRGRVMSAYMVVSMGGAALGTLLLSFAEPDGSTPFIVAAIFASFSVVAVSLARGDAPQFELPPPVKLREVWRSAPVGVWTSTFAGLANAATIGMAGVYAIQIGMSPSLAAVFAAASPVGSVLLQWPIGHLSDSIGRRRVIFVGALAASSAAVLGAAIDDAQGLLVVAMLVFGAFSYPMYSLALTHVTDVLPVGQAVVASSTIVFTTGVGSIVGPVAAAVAMESVSVSGFWWTVATAHALIAVFAAANSLRRPEARQALINRYLAIPARSSGFMRPGPGPESESEGI